MPIEYVFFLLAAGLVAGFVNTVAGGGSVITIPVLTELFAGDAVLANGTNRIAILLQNIVGVGRFRKAGVLPWRSVLGVVPAVILGAAAGAWLGTVISPAAMKRVFGVVVLLVAATVVIKPSTWLGGKERKIPEPFRSLLFFGIGFYGGFIQAGVGFLLLFGLVLGEGMDLIRGNAAKLLLVLLYIPVTVLLFWGTKNVHLLAGLVLGVGNMSGALIATRLAIKKGAGWIRWVLVVAALGAAVRMLLL